jgi:hypothetical protein
VSVRVRVRGLGCGCGSLIQLQLSELITTINKEHDNEAAQRRIKVQSTYSEVAAVAIRKLKANNGEATKLTKKEMLAIVFFVFHTLEDDIKKKDVLVAVLSHHAIKDQIKLTCLRLVPSLAQATLWDADESPFYLGVSMDESATVPMCDMDDL